MKRKTKTQTKTQKICISIRDRIQDLFSDLESGLSQREDSRAFGAMIENRITTSWPKICADLRYEAPEKPGVKTIYDFACSVKGIKYGIDLKTKNLDKGKYSNGGVCSVDNLLNFMVNQSGILLIAEFGHKQRVDRSKRREINYISVAPLHCLPTYSYEIENLGTGQIRLNKPINQLEDEIEWDRALNSFFEFFIPRAIEHYEKVGRVALKRKQSIIEFQNAKYAKFKSIR